jgi:hypothetical protein
MYFSASTTAAVAVFGFGVIPGQVAAVPTEDHSIAERSLFGNWFNTPQNLCDKPNYGAVGKPWDHNSKPGAWCGGQKPSNSGQWAQLVSHSCSIMLLHTDPIASLGWRRLCQVQVYLLSIRLGHLLRRKQEAPAPMGMSTPQVKAFQAHEAFDFLGRSRSFRLPLCRY